MSKDRAWRAVSHGGQVGRSGHKTLLKSVWRCDRALPEDGACCRPILHMAEECQELIAAPTFLGQLVLQFADATKRLAEASSPLPIRAVGRWSPQLLLGGGQCGDPQPLDFLRLRLPFLRCHTELNHGRNEVPVVADAVSLEAA